MILEISRGYIVYRYREKTVTIEGEAYLPGYGSPDFVVYSELIQNWDPLDDQVRIDDDTKKEILLDLEKEMKGREMTVEIE